MNNVHGSLPNSTQRIKPPDILGMVLLHAVSQQDDSLLAGRRPVVRAVLTLQQPHSVLQDFFHPRLVPQPVGIQGCYHCC